MQTDVHKRCSLAFGLGLDELPLYPFHSHQLVLDGLRAGLQQGRQLLCFTSPPGGGKSALLSALYDGLQSGYVGLITQPGLGDLLSRLKGRLQLANAAPETIEGRDLKAALLKAQKHAAPIVQLVDNADKLKRPDFITLRRLVQLVGGQLVLGGTPQLLSLFDDKRADPPPIQPDQTLRLGPMTATETAAYIRHRLRHAGFDQDLFRADASAAVATYSGGLPQLINMLCFMALTESCVTDQQPITAQVIDDVANQRWASGIYPFQAPPPAAAAASDRATATEDAVPDSDTPPTVTPEHGTADTAPSEAIDATPTMAAEPPPDTPDLRLFTREGAPAQATAMPPLYGEQRGATTSPPPAARQPTRLVSGLAGIAVLGLGVGLGLALGLSLYGDASHLQGEYQRFSQAAKTRLERWTASDTASAPERPAPPLSNHAAAQPVRPRSAPVAEPQAAPAAAPTPAIAQRQTPTDQHQQPPAPSGPANQEPLPGTVTPATRVAASQPVLPAEPVTTPDTPRSDPPLPDPPSLLPEASGAVGLDALRIAMTLPPTAAGAGQPTVMHPVSETLAPSADNPAPLSAPDPQTQATEPPSPAPAEQPEVARRQPAQPRQAVPAMTPAQRSYIANLYLKRAEYEMGNGRYRDALISIGYGLESAPDHPVLVGLRSRVLQEIDGQALAKRATH